MSTFDSSSTADRAGCVNPTKHVRYTHGMILGVADFQQEFGYLSARDRWLARDLAGSGVVSGLDVAPRAADTAVIEVGAGVAVGPGGQWIRIDRAQCADLRDWLRGPAVKVELAKRFQPADTAGTVTLFVVLSYRECPTDPGPVPGEACRTEDQWQQPLRLQDSFVLDFAWSAPRQDEEDAVRDFVRWLNTVPASEGTTGLSSVADFLQAIENAVPTLAQPPFAPPPNSTGYFFGSPPAGLRIPAAEVGVYWQAAFHLWVTKLRPLWQAAWLPEGTCCGAVGTVAAGTPPEDRILLAQLAVPLTRNALSGDWELTPGQKVVASLDQRPFLVDSRLLREALLRGPGGAGAAAGAVRHPAGLPGLRLVASGIVGGDNAVPTHDPTYNGLQITDASDGANGKLTLHFDGYDAAAGAANRYVVQITPVIPDAVVTGGILAVVVALDRFDAAGLIIRVTNEAGAAIPFTAADLQGIRYSVQVTQFDL